MSLRLVSIQNSEPLSYPVDPTAIFQPGNIAQLVLRGNNTVAGVSDGTCPFGIIDDSKTVAMQAPSIDEVHIYPSAGQLVGTKYLSIIDTVGFLENSSIVASSFVCDIPIQLREKNGGVIIPAGSELNHDDDGDGINDSFKLTCSYSYLIPGIPGEDTTMGSKRVSLWITRGIFETDQYEVSQRYQLGAPLFCNEYGQLTTKQIIPTAPAIAQVTGIPSARLSFLQFMWF